MKHKFTHILCLCAAAVIFTGCLRDDLAGTHYRIVDLNVNTVAAQVDAMEATTDELKTVSAGLPPVLEALDGARTEIEGQIKALMARLSSAAGDQTELQAAILALQQRCRMLDAAYQAVAAADLETRLAGLEERMESLSGESDARAAAIGTSYESFITLDRLASLAAAAQAIPDVFGDEFDTNLDKCKDLVIRWVSESEAILGLFDDYYTKENMDEKLSILYGAENRQDSLLTLFGNVSDSLDSALHTAIEEAVSGASRHLSEEIDAIGARLDTLLSQAADLQKRVSSLERMAEIIGDYSSYKGTLVADILALQKAVGDTGTITSLVNTLKLVLSDGEDGYYDLAAAVAELYDATFAVDDQGRRLKALEDLFGKLASVEALSALKEDAATLGEKVRRNRTDVAALFETVNEFFARWDDALASSVGRTAAMAEDLRNERDKLLFALGSNLQGEESGIYKVLSDINLAITFWNIPDARDSLDKINTVLEGCNVDGVYGLQNCLDRIYGELVQIWGLLGGYDDDHFLHIGYNIIDAINKLNAKFSGADAAALIAALRADVDILHWIEGEDTLSLASLDSLTTLLRTTMDAKETKDNFGLLRDKVKQIQDYLETLMTTEHFNDSLQVYLLKATADTTYYTVEELTAFIDAYEALFGVAPTPASGTVLERLASLEALVGDIDLCWMSNLYSAVNALHTLVGEKSVDFQADSITRGIIDDLIDTLFNEKDPVPAATVAGWICAFEGEIDTLKNLSVTLGDTLFTYKEIDKAIEYVYRTLMAYVSVDNCEASKGGFATMADRFKNIEQDIIGENYFSTEYTIEDAVKNIFALMGDTTMFSTDAKTLIGNLDSLRNSLVEALVGEGGSVGDSLSLKSIRDRLDNLGFTGVFTTGGKTLMAVLDSMNTAIEGINALLGSDEDGKTLTERLREMQQAVGTFSEMGYASDLAFINGCLHDLDSLLTVDDGKGQGGSVKVFYDKILEFYTGLTTLTVDGENDLQKVLNSFYTDLEGFWAVIGETELPEDIKSVTDAVNLFSQTFTSKLASSIYISIALKERTATVLESMFGPAPFEDTPRDILRKLIYPNCDNLYEYFFQRYYNSILDRTREEVIRELQEFLVEKREYLKTAGHTADFADAVCELARLLEVTDPASLADLEAAIKAVKGEGKAEYATISELGQILTQLYGMIPERPQGWAPDESLYKAATDLYGRFDILKDQLGENTTEFKTVWGAIEGLKARILGRIGGLINSLTYLPEYTDGKATLAANSTRTAFGNVEIDYIISANSRFYERYGSSQRSVKAVLNQVGHGRDTIVGTAVADQATRLLKVYYPADQFAKASLAPDGDVFIATVIIDGEKDEFTSPFVQLYINGNGETHTKRIRSISPLPSAGDIIFAAGVYGRKGITLTPMRENDNLSDIPIAWSGYGNFSGGFTFSGGLNKTLLAKKPRVGDGELSIYDDVNIYTYKIRIIDAWDSKYCTLSPSYIVKDTQDKEVNNTNTTGGLKLSPNQTITIEFDLGAMNTDGKITCEELDFGLYSVFPRKIEPEWINVKVSNNVITITTTGDTEDRLSHTMKIYLTNKNAENKDERCTLATIWLGPN